MLDLIFPTLISKTFVILALALAVSFIGAKAVILFFRKQYDAGASYITNKNSSLLDVEKSKEVDLVINWTGKGWVFWVIILGNIGLFLALLVFQFIFPLNILLFLLFSLSTGVLVGISLIAVDENLGSKVLALTSLATIIAGTIGMFSNIDFSLLGIPLLIALLILVGISFLRIFISIRGPLRKLIALGGVIIFVLYLLYDFGRLSKLSKIESMNNWNIALDLSINIYLDIINLFLQLLDLLSSDS